VDDAAYLATLGILAQRIRVVGATQLDDLAVVILDRLVTADDIGIAQAHLPVHDACDHLHIRARKYRPQVEANAGRYGVSKNLIFAVIKTESDFNPWAISKAPAFGLMQIVPGSAGHDVNRYLKRPGLPSEKTLLDPSENILYGSVFLHLLDSQYLAAVRNPVSREYCVIAAYNTGAGNVLRTFDKNRKKAPDRINRLAPLAVYQTLKTRLPHSETRRYLTKVMQAKKAFVNF